MPGEDGSLLAGPLTRGPWDHSVQHGGSVVGLLGRACEQAGARSDQRVSRLTVEFLGPVPVARLRAEAEIVRPGRRVQLVDGRLWADGPDGPRVVARASCQWVAYDEDRPTGEFGPVPPRPDTASDPDSGEVAYPRPGFNCDAVELRPIEGNTEEPGPGLIWVRLRHPLVAGEATTPFQQAATISDLGIAVGWDHSPAGYPLINCDVTVQLSRYPIGEWLLLRSRLVRANDGVAFAETELSDDHGHIGWVLQSLVENPAAGEMFAAPK